MKEKTRFLIIIIFNIVLVILAVIGAVMSIMNRHSLLATIVYYTQDSNLFLGIISAVYSVSAIKAYRNRSFEIPVWLQNLKYFSVCCIAVTLFVVLFILAPMTASIGGLRWILFTDSMLFQHLLSPVIAIAGFLLFEKRPELPYKSTLFALVPTLIYAIFLYPLNMAGIVDGPYPFLQVRKMSIGMSIMWFFILLALAYILAWLIWLLNRKLKTYKR